MRVSHGSQDRYGFIPPSRQPQGLGTDILTHFAEKGVQGARLDSPHTHTRSRICTHLTLESKASTTEVQATRGLVVETGGKGDS